MIDWFGWKAKAELAQIKALLESERAQHEAVIRSYEGGSNNLIRQLREMDQLAHSIGQTYGQPHFRQHVQDLCALAAYRMHKESDRIRDVLIPEIRKVYTDPKSFEGQRFRAHINEDNSVDKLTAIHPKEIDHK